MTMQSELLPRILGYAVLSEDGVYRYRLIRSWGEGDRCVWVMLNPSTADDEVDDPTIRRCMGFARSWGFDGMEVVNLFALRATNPRTLQSHPDPRGSDNDAFVHDAMIDRRLTVVAWGSHPLAAIEGIRWAEIARRSGAELRCLGTTKHGAPRHPLYVKADQPLRAWPDGDEPTRTEDADADT